MTDQTAYACFHTSCVSSFETDTHIHAPRYDKSQYLSSVFVAPALAGRLGRASFCPFVLPFVRPSVNVRSSVRSSIRQHLPGYLVSATPLTVLYRSFWNFACVFFMVGGCACGLDIIVRLFFVTFSTLWTMSISPSIYRQWIQFCTDLIETLHVFSPWYEDVCVVWIYLLDYF